MSDDARATQQRERAVETFFAYAKEKTVPAAKKAVRKRRTQEERSTQTQDKIVRGAAKCIVEQGYKATTMKAIAEAAGITWGAIQHHFGDKESILKGVTDLGAKEFRERIGHIDLTGLSLQDRVDQFLVQAQKHTGDELYLASMVIVRNMPQKMVIGDYVPWEETLQDIWIAVFGDVNLGKKRHAQVRDFTFMTINAIALEQMSYEGAEKFQRSHVKLLNEVLVNLLSDSRS